MIFARVVAGKNTSIVAWIKMLLLIENYLGTIKSMRRECWLLNLTKQKLT